MRSPSLGVSAAGFAGETMRSSPNGPSRVGGVAVAVCAGAATAATAAGADCANDDRLAHRLFAEHAYPNVIATGLVPFKQLKYYIANAAFCIAPMDKAYPGNTISHQKITQYLAFGKPVFSCVFSDYEASAHLLYMDDDNDQLLSKLTHFVYEGEDPSLASARITLASRHCFDVLLPEIERILA